MEPILFPVLATLAGAYFLARNIRLIRDGAKLQTYIQTSPKAKLWVSKYGSDRTVELTKKYFLPLGLVMSAGLVGIGLWSLSKFL